MSSRDFRQKIKTLDELAAALGPRPRAKTVIMCHGVCSLASTPHLEGLGAITSFLGLNSVEKHAF